MRLHRLYEMSYGTEKPYKVHTSTQDGEECRINECGVIQEILASNSALSSDSNEKRVP